MKIDDDFVLKIILIIINFYVVTFLKNITNTIFFVLLVIYLNIFVEYLKVLFLFIYFFSIKIIKFKIYAP